MVELKAHAAARGHRYVLRYGIQKVERRKVLGIAGLALSLYGWYRYGHCGHVVAGLGIIGIVSVEVVAVGLSAPLCGLSVGSECGFGGCMVGGVGQVGSRGRACGVYVKSYLVLLGDPVENETGRSF